MAVFSQAAQKRVQREWGYTDSGAVAFVEPKIAGRYIELSSCILFGKNPVFFCVEKSGIFE